MADDVVLDEFVPDEVVPDELAPGGLVAVEGGKVEDGDGTDAGVNGDVYGDVKGEVLDGKHVDDVLGRFLATSTSASSSESLAAARLLIRIANRMFEDGSVEIRSSSSSFSEPVSVSPLTERVKSGHRLPIV